VATFALPAGMDPSLAGLELYHAYLAIDGGGDLDLASNAVPVALVP
jgi:hypothetical protein